jgi:Outer membrane protein beta-barrel domain
VLVRIIILIGLLGTGVMLHAQAEPTASRIGDLKVGGGFSVANSDYYHRFNGASGFFGFDFLPHIGVEGDFHFVQGTNGIYEKTYEVGGRYFLTYRKFVPYAKVMYGRGVFNYPAFPDGFHPNLAYNLAAIGVGTDYKLKPWLYVRADWEYQSWFGFQNSSLSPSILTIGGAYRFR